MIGLGLLGIGLLGHLGILASDRPFFLDQLTFGHHDQGRIIGGSLFESFAQMLVGNRKVFLSHFLLSQLHLIDGAFFGPQSGCIIHITFAV